MRSQMFISKPRGRSLSGRRGSFMMLLPALLVLFAVCSGDVRAEGAGDSANHHAQIEKLMEQYRAIAGDKTLAPATRKQRLDAVMNQVLLRKARLVALNEDLDELDAKIDRLRKTGDATEAPKAPAKPNYTKREEGQVAELEKRLKDRRDQLRDPELSPTVARLLKGQIARMEKELADIRKRALARPAPAGETKKTIVISLESQLRAALVGRKANLTLKAPVRKRPWAVGAWQDRFAEPMRFVTLRERYYRFQDALRATLLIRRDKWTGRKVPTYNGQLSTISAHLKVIEREILIGLARIPPNSEIGRKVEQWRQEFRRLSAQEDGIWTRLAAIEKEIMELRKKYRIKPGDTIQADDAAGRKHEYLVAKHYRIQKDELLPLLKKIGEVQNLRVRLKKAAYAEIENSAKAFLKSVGSDFRVHEELGRGQSSDVYAEFLSKEEMSVFTDQCIKREAAWREAQR